MLGPISLPHSLIPSLPPSLPPFLGIFASLSVACAGAGGDVPRRLIALLGVSQCLALSLGMGALHFVMNKEEGSYYKR